MFPRLMENPTEFTAKRRWQAVDWTCSMHPQIHQPKPGKCPLCLMDLIPVETTVAQVGARQIAFSEDALKLMDVETTPVVRKFVEAK